MLSIVFSCAAVLVCSVGDRISVLRIFMFAEVNLLRHPCILTGHHSRFLSLKKGIPYGESPPTPDSTASRNTPHSIMREATDVAPQELLAKQREKNAQLRKHLEELRQARRDCHRQLLEVHLKVQSSEHEEESAFVNHDQVICDQISHSKHQQWLQSELDRLNQCNIEAKDAFVIAVQNNVASINGVRLESPHWKQVNAALGQVTLLLSHIEERYLEDGVATDCLRYQLVAAGSQSKIRLRSSNSTLYNLYFAEDSFQFFGRRSFNTALGFLVGYVQDLTAVLQESDRTIVVPYACDSEQHLVGGLSVLYTPTNNNTNTVHDDWTRAMKYLMTNIKHLMVYWAIGVCPKQPPVASVLP